MSRFEATGFMVLPGAIEGADFDGYAVSPLKMAARVQAVESLINVALDRPDIDVFSGRRPLESFAVPVDYDDIDHWAGVARAFFGMFVLPNYAVIAKWRLMVGSTHRGKRTAEQSRDLLIELLDWLIRQVGWVPMSWSWLCLAEFGIQSVSQSIVDGVFKTNKPDVGAAINSAAWDCSLISFMVCLQGTGEDRSATVLVTDDEAFSRAAGFILPVGEMPGYYGVDPDMIQPHARNAWSVVMEYRAIQIQSRDLQRQPEATTTPNDAWATSVLLVRELQAQLGIAQPGWYREDLRVEQHCIDTDKLTHLLDAFAAADTAAELVDNPAALFTLPGQENLDIDDLLHMLSIAQYALEVLGRKRYSEHFHGAARYAHPNCPPDRIHEMFEDPDVERAVELMYHWGSNATAMQVALENLLTPLSRADRDDARIEANTIALTWGLLHVWQDLGASPQLISAEMAEAFSPPQTRC